MMKQFGRFRACALVLLLLGGAGAGHAESWPAISDPNLRPGGLLGLGIEGTVGWEFIPSNEIQVTDLGFFDLWHDGLGVAHDVGIWTAGGELVVSATVPKGTAGLLEGDYRYVPVEPTLLLASETYVIGAVMLVPKMEPSQFEPDFCPETSLDITSEGVVLDDRIGGISLNRYVRVPDPALIPELEFPYLYKDTFMATDPLSGQEVMVGFRFVAPNFRFVPEPTILATLPWGWVLCGRKGMEGRSLSCQLG